MPDLTTRDDIVAALRGAGFADADIDRWVRFDPMPASTPTADPDQLVLFTPPEAP